ncbi:MAG TPA: hypothetical protein VKV79_08390 [Terriglobia bacterium]|nr:hypothetical protein [Terriglobia bacterium]
MPYPCEEHLRRIKRGIAARIDRKYRAGQHEHGGNLWEKSSLALIEEALDEVIDLAVYLETLRETLAGKGSQ